MLEWKQIPFNPDDRTAFINGLLAPKWASRYPFLFDAADLDMTRSQPRYHFYEWFAAVEIYEHIGFHSLAEKYQFKKHKQDHAIFKELVGLSAYHQIAESGNSARPQAPDLLVYKPDRSEWFFCEVKGPGDDITPTQSQFFAMIERVTGSPVRIARLRPDAETSRAALQDGA
ncbi:MAG TPA: VRR-NUC domain-containing protein [Anaerolineales bacterium]|nr:VRR-NUC domain-containing protein [Anaerolineales bacterium]